MALPIPIYIYIVMNKLVKNNNDQNQTFHFVYISQFDIRSSTQHAYNETHYGFLRLHNSLLGMIQFHHIFSWILNEWRSRFCFCYVRGQQLVLNCRFMCFAMTGVRQGGIVNNQRLAKSALGCWHGLTITSTCGGMWLLIHVITNGGLVQPPLMIGRGWSFTSHIQYGWSYLSMF